MIFSPYNSEFNMVQVHLVQCSYLNSYVDSNKLVVINTLLTQRRQTTHKRINQTFLILSVHGMVLQDEFDLLRYQTEEVSFKYNSHQCNPKIR